MFEALQVWLEKNQILSHLSLHRPQNSTRSHDLGLQTSRNLSLYTFQDLGFQRSQDLNLQKISGLECPKAAVAVTLPLLWSVHVDERPTDNQPLEEKSRNILRSVQIKNLY